MNTLVVIGWLGARRCYLNVPPDEALRRYCASTETDPRHVEEDVTVFEFADEFGAYDAWALS